MPVLILLGDSKKLISLILPYFSDYEIHDGEFTQTKSVLSNMSPTKLYILLNCDLKPYRYEVYCLVKKQEGGYCILTDKELSGAKHDNLHIISDISSINTSSINTSSINTSSFDISLINTHLTTKLIPTTAHKKKIVNNNNYLSSVKNIINKVNLEYKEVLQTVKKDSEYKILKMISLNPVDLKDIEGLYKKIIEST